MKSLAIIGQIDSQQSLENFQRWRKYSKLKEDATLYASRHNSESIFKLIEGTELQMKVYSDLPPHGVPVLAFWSSFGEKELYIQKKLKNENRKVFVIIGN